eukprot:Skav204103  [mRNA]  locus=scaffold1472:183805:204244:- [translate_table: standard]
MVGILAHACHVEYIDSCLLREQRVELGATLLLRGRSVNAEPAPTPCCSEPSPPISAVEIPSPTDDAEPLARWRPASPPSSATRLSLLERSDWSSAKRASKVLTSWSRSARACDKVATSMVSMTPLEMLGMSLRTSEITPALCSSKSFRISSLLTAPVASSCFTLGAGRRPTVGGGPLGGTGWMDSGPPAAEVLEFSIDAKISFNSSGLH